MAQSGSSSRPATVATLPCVDFRRAVPAQPAIVAQSLAATLADLAASDDLARIVREPAGLGSAANRSAGAGWLSGRLGSRPPIGRIVLTHGTQSALSLVLRGIVTRHGVVGAEPLTYTSLPPLAAHLGVRLVAIAFDEQGMQPDALEAACHAQRVEAVYLNPTIQNPTATIMPEARRDAIIAVARRFGVAIIEDDVQGFLAGPEPRPFAALAPDITWYVAAFGKSINLGLRIAYLCAPSDDAVARVIAPVQMLTYWGASALSAEIAQRWLADGTAARITRAVQAEIADRQRIAAETLRGAQFTGHAASNHIWLRLPARWPAEAFTLAAEHAGVTVWPAARFALDPHDAPNAVRLSLSNPVTSDDVRRGLETVARLLRRSD